MSKFLYLQDFHISGKNPCNRNDNYYESMLLKLDEVLEIAKINKVDFVIDGGDFFESPIVTNTIVDDVLDRIESKKIKWFMLYGNHCEIGKNINVSGATSISHMIRRSKFVEHLETIETEDLFIQGFDYYHSIESDLKEKGLMSINKRENKIKIAVIHALITLKSLPDKVMHLPIKALKTDFDYVFVAHNHKGWSEFQQKGVKIANISCLGRSAVDEADIKPTVAIYDSKTDNLSLIPLKCAKLGKDVFELDKIEQLKNFEGEINKFIASLDTEKIKQLDLMGIIEYLAKEQNLEETVKQEIIKRIGEKNGL